MKHLRLLIAITLLLSGFFSISSFAQGNIIYNLQVIGNDSQAIQGIQVEAVESNTYATVKGVTGEQGKLTLELNMGEKWMVSIGQIEKCRVLNALNGRMIEINAQYVYDLEDYQRKIQQDSATSREGFSIVESMIKKDTPFQPDSCFLVIQLEHPDGHLLKDFRISVVNSRDSLIYSATTDQRGRVYFILPDKTAYDIDVEESINYSYCDFGDEYTKRSLILQYAPTEIKELIRNDTVYQANAREARPSSERALVLLNVTGGSHNGRNEEVFLQQLHSNKVFAGKTDMKGRVWFLLPTESIYMINMEFQKNIDVVNLNDFNELTIGEFPVLYNPDPLTQFPERFIPTTDRLVTKDFNSFLEKQLEKPAKKPFLIKIASAFRINRESREALFTISLASSDIYGKSFRAPMNLVLVLDKSGSMYSSGRYEAMQFSLREIGTVLTKEDLLSVILFNMEPYRVSLPREDYRHELNQIATYYDPGGGTFIYKALFVGMKDLMMNYDPGKSNHLLLLTDGYGIAPPDTIIAYVQNQAKKDIEISTIGLGQDYNQSLLRLIAENGNGNFSAVDSANYLSDVFSREINASFSYVARDLNIDIFHHDKLLYSHLYGYVADSVSDNQVSFHINKLPHSREQIAFLKFKLDDPSPEIEEHPLRLVVSYYDPIRDERIKYTEEIPLTWTDETDTELLFDQEEKKLYAIAVLNQTLKLMSQAFDVGDNKAARQHLRNGREQIESIYPEAKPREVKKIFDEVDKYIELFNRIETNRL
jgi:Ca-activated chloride channel family protein